MTKPKRNPNTIASFLFKNKDVLVTRPQEMSQQEYREARRIQTRVIKKIFAGRPNQNILSAMGIKFKYNQH